MKDFKFSEYLKNNILLEEPESIESTVKEAARKKSAFYKLGWSCGGNARTAVDPNSEEAKIIMSKVDMPISDLEKDREVVEFTKGYVDSAGSSHFYFDGIATIAKLLLKLKKNGWPKPGRVL